MTESKKSNWQLLMDSAYDKWNDNRTYSQFLASLDCKERQAVLLGNMNYQIGNGGVEQWVDNGYACHAGEVLDVLRLIGTPRAVEWASKLERFVDEFVDPKAKNKGFGGNYWLDDECNVEDDGECEESYHFAAADELTNYYYDEQFNKELLRDIDEFLSK